MKPWPAFYKPVGLTLSIVWLCSGVANAEHDKNKNKENKSSPNQESQTYSSGSGKRYNSGSQHRSEGSSRRAGYFAYFFRVLATPPDSWGAGQRLRKTFRRTEGDLVKLEPGQESGLTNATETSFVTMRVMSSKGEDGEVPAGTLIRVSLKTLQDFDSEFSAKLALGLAEAEKNSDQFKSGSSKASS